jgi:hypothetical protein
MTDKQTQQLIDAVESIDQNFEANMLYELTSDATGWNIVEAIENIYFELKRMNDRAEGVK